MRHAVLRVALCLRLDEEADLQVLKRNVALLVLGAVIEQLPRGDVENVDICDSGLAFLRFVAIFVDFVLDEDELVLEKFKFLLELVLTERVLFGGILQEADLQILQLLVLWRLDEVVLHQDIIVNRKRIIVDRELLKRSAVRMSI